MLPLRLDQALDFIKFCRILAAFDWSVSVSAASAAPFVTGWLWAFLVSVFSTAPAASGTPGALAVPDCVSVFIFIAGVFGFGALEWDDI